MSKVVAKLSLDDPFGNPHTLLVKVSTNKVINYSLSGTVSRIPMCITNMQVREALPELMLDFKDVPEMIDAVKESINTGTDSITEIKIYDWQTIWAM